MLNELQSRRNYLNGKVETVYFGGGTPSLLSGEELHLLLESVYKHFEVDANAEITLEANPDDLSLDYLKSLKNAGVNRLSIGTQSFDDEILTWMNRSHNAIQATESIEHAADLGFKDINIDLIYGVPNVDLDLWKSTVEKALDLPINHISGYSLTLEQNTPYNKLVNQQKYLPPNDELSNSHLQYLLAAMKKDGWERYEISNYCKNENYSKHNTNYWFNQPFLGIGPSAHSYNKESRSWNVASNKKYLKALQENLPYNEVDVLSPENKFNEQVLTGLRTKWGVKLDVLNLLSGSDFSSDFENEIQTYLVKKWIEMENGTMKLTTEGMLYADYISSSFFKV